MVNWGRFMLIKSTNVLSQPTLMSIRAKQSTLESPFKVKRAVIPGNLSRDFELTCWVGRGTGMPARYT
jgi:hypothetical protein